MGLFDFSPPNPPKTTAIANESRENTVADEKQTRRSRYVNYLPTASRIRYTTEKSLAKIHAAYNASYNKKEIELIKNDELNELNFYVVIKEAPLHPSKKINVLYSNYRNYAALTTTRKLLTNCVPATTFGKNPTLREINPSI